MTCLIVSGSSSTRSMRCATSARGHHKSGIEVRGVCVEVSSCAPHAVRAQPGHDDDQPATHVVDGVDVHPGQTFEGFLDDVFCFGQAARHSEGDVEHVTYVVPLCASDLRLSVSPIAVRRLSSFHACPVVELAAAHGRLRVPLSV
jgi:hypothetical protein